MAITNYTELKAAVASWVKRTDLEGDIPDLIALAEKRLNRLIRCSAMDNAAESALASGGRTLALPSGMVELASVALQTATGYSRIQYVTPAEFDLRRSTTAAKPDEYTVSDVIEFAAPADQAYTVQLRYYKGWDIAADSTNWLLTNYPDAYLYGALLQAEGFTVNDPRMQLWAGLVNEAIGQINAQEARTRARGAVLRTELPHSRYDITQG